MSEVVTSLEAHSQTVYEHIVGLSLNFHTRRFVELEWTSVHVRSL